MIRHRDCFGDLETWMVWGNIAVSHQYHLSKNKEAELIKEKSIDPIGFNNYYNSVVSLKMKQGINASSIADITAIPRATVIRKLNWLMKQRVVKKNKNLEYYMVPLGKMNKNIAQNFLINQNYVAEFLTDIFDLMKNSNFKV